MQKEQQPTFQGLGIHNSLLNSLGRAGFNHPTPIQQKSIPVGIKGEDLIGIAQTGTGKTMAFSIPMLQRIAETGMEGLILLPTRELAIQVDEELQKIGRSFGLRTAVLIGGASMFHQIKALRNKPQIIVATPGRLNDHIEQKNVSLKNVGILVLDEADRMLDMGFEPQIKRILASVSDDRQTMLFSATMPPAIEQIAKQYMRMPVRVEVAPAGTTAERVEQEVFIVEQDKKLQLLDQMLREYTGTVLVFSRTKHRAKKIAATVRRYGHTAAELHSNRTLAQRRTALEGFKSGKVRVLVATDIAARGIDVKNIELVINFDLPDNSEDYVHRIGRTGRNGTSGKAISFAAPNEKRDIKSIERLIRSQLRSTRANPAPVQYTGAPAPEYFGEQKRNFQPRRRNFGGGRDRDRSRNRGRNRSRNGQRSRERQYA